MRATIRRRLSMAETVLDFSRENPATDPGYVGVVERLEEALDRASALGREAVDTSEGELLAVHHRAALRSRIQQQLRHLAAVGRAAMREREEFDEVFRPPWSNVSHLLFLVKARINLERATEHQELLLKYALGQTFLTDLAHAIAEFDALGEAANLDRVIHVGARRDLSVTTSECMALIGALDGFNRTRFADDARLLGAWEAARSTFGHGKRRAQESEAA